MYDAPLLCALTELAGRRGVSRFHMPGHKGRAAGSIFETVFPVDYTELPATGNLYEENGPIALAEQRAAQWYGMDGCFFLTCGATQGLKAALHTFCAPGSAVVLDRNCHKSVLDACAQINLLPQYIYPRFSPETGVTGDIDVQAFASLLQQSGARTAVITSPTYYGRCLNVAQLAAAAHDCGCRLIVDSAHGSHLRACGSADAALLGADIVIFSAHKTLSAAGQGAYLAFRGLSSVQRQQLRENCALYGTTSPSYIIMASLDFARARMELDNGLWQYTAQQSLALRRCIEEQTPFRCLAAEDPCRLTVLTKPAGISGFETAERLFALGAEPEMQDDGRVVFILSAQDTQEDRARLLQALQAAAAGPPKRPVSPGELPLPPQPEAVLTPAQALFAPKELRPLRECQGCVAGQHLAPYPPGVAAVVMGESLTKFCVEYLLKKGYNEDTYIRTINNAVLPRHFERRI